MRTVLVLLMLTSLAAAERVAPLRAKTTSCKPNGAVWFELEVIDDEWNTYRIYANGATTRTVTTIKSVTADKVDRVENVRRERCLRAGEMADVEKLLKSSPWKVTQPEMTIRCENVKTTRITVRVFGKRVFMESGCDPDKLDETSAQALWDLRLKLNAIPKRCLDNPLAKGCL